jgi:large subunit ribosomal protein L23
MNLKYIIKRPIITEKSLEATKDNRYTFEVAVRANKEQIKAAIKSAFDVDAVAVWTSTKKPVTKSSGRRRMPGETAETKKAIVEIKAGQSIKVFETKGQ